MSCLVAPPSRYYHYIVMKKQREISHRFSINRKTLKSIFQINWCTLKMLLLMKLCIHIDIKTKSIRKNINTIIVTSNFYHYNSTFGFLFQSFTTLICTSEMAVTVSMFIDSSPTYKRKEKEGPFIFNWLSCVRCNSGFFRNVHCVLAIKWNIINISTALI